MNILVFFRGKNHYLENRSKERNFVCEESLKNF